MSHPSVANLITRSGKTMTQIARESGVTLSYISKIRSGQKTPSAVTILAMSASLGVGVEEMMRALGLYGPESARKEAA